jgi:hypothetical protein
MICQVFCAVRGDSEANLYKKILALANQKQTLDARIF